MTYNGDILFHCEDNINSLQTHFWLTSINLHCLVTVLALVSDLSRDYCGAHELESTAACHTVNMDLSSK